MSRAPTGTFQADPELVRLADQCVKCGLCLPHCPTYRVGRIEAEGPRGRIALARALATGELAPTPSARGHLDQCLACLSCEVVCPSQVRYGALIDRVRAGLAQADARAGRRPDALARLLHAPLRLARLARVASFLRTGRWLPRIAGLLPPGRLRRLAAVQAVVPARVPLPPRRARASAGRVALFRGCVADVQDRDTLAAARRLLEACGYEVAETPAACCGALQRHAGDAAGAAAQGDRTRALLQATGAGTVLCCASGCFGDLQLAAGDSMRVLDVAAFLAADAGFAALRFRPLAARAALHRPCTQVNVVGHEDAIGQVLARIPGIDVLALPLQPRCCGAAGSYFIEHPRIADALRGEKLAQAQVLAPDMLLTTNIGCRIHLAAGLRAAVATTPVLHPLALLARQLDNPGA
jgi:glycolate oxidase iron-sulfur subunit